LSESSVISHAFGAMRSLFFCTIRLLEILWQEAGNGAKRQISRFSWIPDSVRSLDQTITGQQKKDTDIRRRLYQRLL
jgi:hypothetical protein